MLSKSRYLAGLQCPLRLWHQCYDPDLASEKSAAYQAMLEIGQELGKLATCLYPGGVLIEEEYRHHDKAVQATLEAMKDPNVAAIYEAAFVFDGVRVRVDILERLGNGQWNLIEVKSSTSVKAVYIPDVAIQYHVLRGAGLSIDRTFLLLVNNQYVYNGKQLDLERFFYPFDLTDQVRSHQEEIPRKLDALKMMLAGLEPPEILPSRHCNNPYSCEFWKHCTRDMPEHWVMELTGIKQEKLDELAAMGIKDIMDIPKFFSLNMLQERIKRSVINDEDYISKKLAHELEDVEYPVHFLDFETVSAAIPRYAGTRPYQAIPFQWSDHILSEDGTIEHLEYLSEEDKDSRQEFARTLLDALSNKGNIFIYADYEKGIIRELARHLPQYRHQLLKTLRRFKDLYALIKKCYYHPGFHGSFSLKSVLAVLIPDMNYRDLPIQEGSYAFLAYLRMLDPTAPLEEKRKIKRDLLTYCGYDTLGMLRIREELLKRF